MSYQKKQVFTCEWFGVELQRRQKDIPALGGKPFFKFILPDGAMVLPVTPDNKLVLIRQFRPAIERYSIEIPSGAIEPGDSAIETARRELYEETGYCCDEYHLVGEGVVRMDREDALNSFVIGLDAKLDPKFVAEEDIEVLLVDAADIPQMVLDNTFDHIAALPIFLMAKWKLGIDIIYGPSNNN